MIRENSAFLAGVGSSSIACKYAGERGMQFSIV